MRDSKVESSTWIARFANPIVFRKKLPSEIFQKNVVNIHTLVIL